MNPLDDARKEGRIAGLKSALEALQTPLVIGRTAKRTWDEPRIRKAFLARVKGLLDAEIKGKPDVR